MTEQLKKARALLADVTPLKTDCGLLCDHACCKPSPDSGDCVWLFPGEEDTDFFWGEIRDVRLPATGISAKSLFCQEMCDRNLRPFGCMIFPLVPYFSKKKNAWSVRMDRRAYMLCPLTGYGKMGLNPEFVANAEKAVRILSETESGERFLEALAREESIYREPVF